MSQERGNDYLEIAKILKGLLNARISKISYAEKKLIKSQNYSTGATIFCARLKDCSKIKGNKK